MRREQKRERKKDLAENDVLGRGRKTKVTVEYLKNRGSSKNAFGEIILTSRGGQRGN
jgi:hypothetical protein